MDFIEMQIAEDIKKFKELEKMDAYSIKLIKIIYNPNKYNLHDLEEFQHFIERHFKGVPIAFEESNDRDNLTFALGIE